MRLFAAVGLATALILAATAPAQEQIVPKGMIGIQLKLVDGKIVVHQLTTDDSPAAKAGIKVDDVLVKVNDFKVKDKDATQEDLHATVKEVVKNEPGTKLKVTVRRADKEMTVEVTVGKPVALPVDPKMD
jgi:C-terminal processing protease CtpA/Prc